MTEHWNRKYPLVAGIDIEAIRDLLKTANTFGVLELKDAIRVFSCDGPNADRKLRALAHAGYITVDFSGSDVLKWKRTILGNALAGERKARRIKSERVKEIISGVTARGWEINADPDRLHRVRLKLFGSALDEGADDYGDVDVSVEFHKRELEGPEMERIEAALKSRCNPENLNFLGKLMMAENQDKKEIKAILKKGFGPLSLMVDDPATLGASYRWLVDHDVEEDRARPTPTSVVRPNTPPLEESEPSQELPPETAMQAQYRPIADNRKLSVDDLSFYRAAEADELEARIWTPVVSRDGTLQPEDLRADRDASLAGFQHICPIWKEDCGALEMLERSLDWCEQNSVWVKDLFPYVSISKQDRSQIIRYGLSYPDIFVVKVSPKSWDAELRPYTRKRVSRLDLAGAYAVGFSLAKLYREMGCFRMPHFNAMIVMSNPTAVELPDLPKLLKADALAKGGIDGRLMEFSLFDDTEDHMA